MANYIIFNEKQIKNSFKFQIGKRYKINGNLYKRGFAFFKNFKEIEFNFCRYPDPEMKICEVKIFDKKKNLNGEHKTFDFKIKKEINYKNKIDSERLQKEILILKFHDSKTIYEILNSNFNYTYYSDIITTKIPKYFDMIFPYFQLDNILENFFIEYANEKQIDIIINKSKNIYTLLRILDFFSTKYFNKIYESVKEIYGESSEEIRMLNNKIIQQKNKKYISNLISDESYHSEIVKTGIDEYLDYFINNSDNQGILVDISKIGRKKDFDYFLKNISKFKEPYKNDLLTQIAHFGNDGHLDFPELIESNVYAVYHELFNHGRLKDLNEMKKHKEVSYLFDFDSVKFPW